MSTVLHVGNLSPTVDHRDLEALFAAHGTVRRAVVAAPGPTGRDAETGIVEMGCEAEADSAIAALHGGAYCGRLLQVAHATTRQQTNSKNTSMFESMNVPEASEDADVQPRGTTDDVPPPFAERSKMPNEPGAARASRNTKQ